MVKKLKVIYKAIDIPEKERDARIIEAFKILIESSGRVSGSCT